MLKQNFRLITIQITYGKGLMKRLSIVFSFVVVSTRPLSRDGDMTENHAASETVQLPRAWTRGRRETESRQRVSGPESP